jgi:hypothetical protein
MPWHRFPHRFPLRASPRHAFQNAVKRSLVDVCLLQPINYMSPPHERNPAEYREMAGVRLRMEHLDRLVGFDAPTCGVVVGRDRFLTAPSTRPPRDRPN